MAEKPMPSAKKPCKPRPDYPLFPHASGQWAKKINGKLEYFGPWANPEAAEARYLAKYPAVESPSVPANGKVGKPYPDFPLWPNPNGQWCKKIRGRVHYFGAVADWRAALDKYLDQKDDLFAGRRPRPKGGLTLQDLINRFIQDRQRKADSGELNPRTVEDYGWAIKRMLKTFKPEQAVAELGPQDFADLRANLSKTRGPFSLLGDITRIKTLFKFAADNCGVLVHYGSSFNKPTKAVLRRTREAKGPRMYAPDQLRQMIQAASVPLRAMIYLGINCGFGNEDCATLPLDRLDLDNGWHTYGRPKTGVPRRCPLWSETVAALRAVLAERPKPRDAKATKLVFLTHHGRSWARRVATDSVISKELAKVLKDLGIHRKGVNFYALRHTFFTIGEESGDETATSFIMGHVGGRVKEEIGPAARNEEMAAFYRERMTDVRLKRVVEHVRTWLFATARPAGSSNSSPGNPPGPAAGGDGSSESQAGPPAAA